MGDDTARRTLAIIVPFFNEEAVIDGFLAELDRVLDSLAEVESSVIVIDDGSTDSSLERLNALAARNARLMVFSLSRNFGHQNALSAGLDVADADAVIMMDGDLQHPPSLIPDMVARWRTGIDVVSAIRLTTRDSTFLKRFTANAFYWVINRISDVPIVAGAADFCLLSRRAHEALRAMPERHRFLRGMVSWIGFPRAVVTFEAPARVAGDSKYTIAKMVGLAFDAVFAFSAAPMRLAAQVGLLLTASGGVYLAFVVGRFFIYRDLVRGWASLASVLLILGGVQLAFIGLIGEYLARVFEQVKGRPLYVFKQQPDAASRRIRPL